MPEPTKTTKALSLDDVTEVLFKAPNTIQTCLHPVTGQPMWTDKSLEEYLADDPELERLPIEEAIKRQEDHYRTPPVRITEEQYHEALNVLPPLNWVRGGYAESFKMSEMLSGRITGIYVRTGDAHWCFNDLVTMSHGEAVAKCWEARTP